MVTCNMWMNKRGLSWALAFCCVAFAPCVRAENWPRFRGPNGQGVSETEGIPTKWSEADYQWKVNLPGKGHSSPVIWDDKVFVTCADERSRRGFVLCLNESDGTERWRRQEDLSKYPINSLNSYASATPAVDAERVYVLWPGAEQTLLTALSHEGHELWGAAFSGVRARHGKGSSPIVCGGYVIVSHEQERNSDGVESQWLAVDGRTGEVAWRRAEGPVANASYSTPCVYEDGAGRAQLVFASNAHGISGVDAKTGATLWEVDDVLPDRVVSSPLLAGQMIFATCGEGGRGKHLVAVKPVREGQEWRAEIVYELDDRKILPYVPTLVARGELLFGFQDGGTVSCLDMGTGQVRWSEKPAGRFFGSPVRVGGVLYAMTTGGDVVVLKADSSYKLLGVNALGEKSHATPAVGNGRMVLRTESHVVCIGSGGQ